MKKSIFIVLAMAIFASCYDDYVKDYDVRGVGFANQVDVRSVVVGESMQFSTGIALGGIISNDQDRNVDFAVDYSLVDDSVLEAMKTHKFNYIQTLAAPLEELKPLSADQYRLLTESGVSGKAVIKKGTHLGKIVIKLEDSFLDDQSRVLPGFVIPLRIVRAGDLSLIEGRETSVIGVRYEALFFGHWWHGGKTVIKDVAGNEVETVTYYTEIPQADTKVWTLTTVTPYSLTANAVGSELNSAAPQMTLSLGDDGKVIVSSVAGAKYVVEQDGDCSWNKASLLQNRKIYLKYKYEKDGNVYHAEDTLTFRNRVRDGVNEWQDEDQNKYE